MKIRDLLAVPFWAFAQLLDRIALEIGEEYTAQLYLETHIDPRDI